MIVSLINGVIKILGGEVARRGVLWGLPVSGALFLASATTDMPVNAWALFFGMKIVLAFVAICFFVWVLSLSVACSGGWKKVEALWKEAEGGPISKGVDVLAAMFFFGFVSIVMGGVPFIVLSNGNQIVSGLHSTFTCSAAIKGGFSVPRAGGVDIESLCMQAGFPEEVWPWKATQDARSNPYLGRLLSEESED